MSQTKIKNKNQHVPVLMREVLETLDPKVGERYADLTAGYGGHSDEILSRTKAPAVLIDRDGRAVAELKKRFKDSPQIEILHLDFLTACNKLVSEGQQFDLVLADLGVSSPHLDNAGRGFSFLNEGPLDMRMDESQKLTAADVVNTYPLSELERILREYGEEPKAKKMAQAIIAARPLSSTLQLAKVAKGIWPGHSKAHPATRLFQALRIEVNDELKQLEAALPLMVQLLRSGGRLGIITFHSLEDRLTKRFFKNMAGNTYDAELVEITAKPRTATPDELVFNPRSRSAKIRVVAKIKTKEGQGS